MEKEYNSFKKIVKIYKWLDKSIENPHEDYLKQEGTYRALLYKLEDMRIELNNFINNEVK